MDLLAVLRSIFTKVALVVICTSLFACGGGGGGGSTDPDPTPGPVTPEPEEPEEPEQPEEPEEPEEPEQPTTPEPPANSTQASGFDADTSDVVAVIVPAQGTQPRLVLMRDAETGVANSLAAQLPDGTFFSSDVDSSGRVQKLSVADAEFEFSGYTATNVRVNYQLDAESASAEALLDMSACTPSALPVPTAESSPDQVINLWLDWYEESSYTCLLEALDAVVENDFAEPLAAVQSLTQQLLDQEFELATTAHNPIICDTSVEVCAAVVAEQAAELLQGLREIDPNQQTVAGFSVTQSSVRLDRQAWEPLLQSAELDLDWRTAPCEQSIFAEIDPECTQQYIPPGSPPGYVRGTSFVHNDITYSTAPVLEGDIIGFGYSILGVGVSDGEGGGAHVWYGSDSCVSFRIDGSGVQDLMGGTSTTIDSFPWVDVSFVPGTQGATIHRMRGFGYPMLSALDPNYVRRDELRSFQWGVRMTAEGGVYQDYRGFHYYLLRFEDGTTQGAAWDPVTNGPADTFMVGSGTNSLRRYSSALPTENHFCYFREQTTMQLEPRCVENTVPQLNNAVRKLCYSNGQLNGDYELTSQYGATLESGQFENNRPTSGWTFWHDNGEVAATGQFGETGMHGGPWEYFDQNGTPSETVPFSSVLIPAEDGTYHRYLDGAYTEYRDEDGYPFTSGSFREGEKDGPWQTYGDLQTLLREDVYDADNQLPTGSLECDFNGNCVEATNSLLRSSRHFIWQACGISYPYIRDVTYSISDGAFVSEACSRLEGTPLDFSIGEALTYCPRHCM